MTGLQKRHFFWVLVLAVLVRAFVFMQARGLEYGISAAFKLGDTARHVLEGRGFVWDPEYLKILNQESTKLDPLNPRLELFEEILPPQSDPSKLQPFRGRPPGYSVIVAATWKVFGKKMFAYSQALFALLDVASCVIIWWVAGQLFGPTTGLVAGILYGLALPNALLSIFPGHDAIGTFPLSSAALLIWLFLRNGKWPYLILAGVMLGMGTLIRQEPYFIPFVFALAFCLVSQWKNAVKILIVMQVVIVLTNVPWTMRNKRLFEKSIPLSPSVAASLLAGIGDYPNPWGVKASDAWLRDFVASKVGLQPYHSVEFNRVCMEEFLRIVKESPGWYAKSVMRRALKSLHPTVMPFRNSYTFYKIQGGSGGPMQFASQYPLEAMLPVIYKLLWILLWGLSSFAVIKTGLDPGNRHRAFILALFGIPVYYLVTHVFMHCEARFLLPGYFPLFILGTHGALLLAANLLNMPSADHSPKL